MFKWVSERSWGGVIRGFQGVSGDLRELQKGQDVTKSCLQMNFTVFKRVSWGCRDVPKDFKRFQKRYRLDSVGFLRFLGRCRAITGGIRGFQRFTEGFWRSYAF